MKLVVKRVTFLCNYKGATLFTCACAHVIMSFAPSPTWMERERERERERDREREREREITFSRFKSSLYSCTIIPSMHGRTGD